MSTTATRKSKLSKPQLKRGLYKNELHSNPIEMYVIENAEDLKKFLAAFPKMREFKRVVNGFKEDISRGMIITANDPNAMAGGFNTYCYESKQSETPHPSDYIRIELITD